MDALDLSGGTPLHRAAYWNANPDILAALLLAGADPAVTDNFGDTAHRFAAKRSVPNTAIAALLQEAQGQQSRP